MSSILGITVASILTLAILMQVTAKVDWESRFAPATRPPQSPGPPTAAPEARRGSVDDLATPG